jgi:hypothetical protein
MPGKWAKLRGKFESAPASNMSAAAEPKWLAKVDFAKVPYAKLTLGELMKAFDSYDQEKETKENEIKDINVELEALGSMIAEKFQGQEINSIKTDFGKTLYLNTEPYTTVSDREVFEKHVSDTEGLDYLWAVPWQSLNSLVKGLLEAGQDDQIPPGLAVFLKSSVRIRKS